MKRLSLAMAWVLMATTACEIYIGAPGWVYWPSVAVTFAAAVWWTTVRAGEMNVGERDNRLRREESIRQQERFRCFMALSRRAEQCTAAGDALRATAFAEAAEIAYLADVESTL